MHDIDRLTIQLPHGTATRAGAIARQLGRELATSGPRTSGAIEFVDAGPVVMDPASPDGLIARRVAEAVRAAIGAARARTTGVEGDPS